jgi:dTDP-6-deoxy-L-talose 4-dehydrogenase (NAD+)
MHLDVNLPGQYAFLENLLANGLKDLTVTGTCFEYGMQEGELKESLPALPQNPYGIAKNELRKKLEYLKGQLQFNLKWVRLFYMYGPGQNPNSLLSQLENALAARDKVFNMSGGEQVRDFLPVEQVAAYIADIALQDRIQGIINCCSGLPVTVKAFVEDYLKKTNRSISLNLGHYPYADYEPMRFWGNTEKLNKIINHD